MVLFLSVIYENNSYYFEFEFFWIIEFFITSMTLLRHDCVPKNPLKDAFDFNVRIRHGRSVLGSISVFHSLISNS